MPHTPQPRNGEAGCHGTCNTEYYNTTNPSYKNWLVSCYLDTDCGCDITDPHCPNEQSGQHCDEASSTLGSLGDQCPYSCCTVSIHNSYVQCLACTQSFVKSRYASSDMTIKQNNECVLAETCGDPCGLTCPSYHCEVIDANLTGRNVGWKCVLDTAAKSGSSSGSTKSSAETVCECKTKVASGEYNWCPADKQKGCCPKDKVCCGGDVCCNPTQKCDYNILVGNYCNNDKCPPDKPKLCPGKSFSACCKAEDECGVFAHGVAYCKKPDCNEGSSGYCAPGLCCGPLEKCETSHGISKCIPSGCPSGQTLCQGTGKFAQIALCCNACAIPMPNGYPQCQ